MEENYQKQLLLYGWMPQASVSEFIENQCTAEERARKDEILARWARARDTFNAKTALAFESISFAPLNQNVVQKVGAIANDARFRHTFKLPTEFRMVDVDKLIACQATVVLDYVEKLVAQFPKKPSDEDLIDICLSLDKTVPAVAELRLNENSVIYSSENIDLRFLGAIPKPLEQVDLQSSSSGGIPTKGLLLLFGYGGSPVSVIEVGKRVFLNNGFHRVVALRRLGVTRVPVVVQIVKNALLEFPAVYLNLPREYLLTSSSLPVMEDYFKPEMTIELRMKARRRGIKVAWMAEPIDVPL